MSGDGLEERIRSLAARRYLPNAHLARWLGMDEPSRAALFGVAENLKLRTGQLVSALELLEEIAVREASSPAAILARSEVQRAMNGCGSTPARASAFLDALRAIRFPSLARTMASLQAAIAELRLPSGLEVVLPKDLSSDELVIRLRARTGAQLKRLVAALAGREDELVRLARMLGGEDEF